MLKTHSCGELRAEHIGQQVTLAGWVHRFRSHGGVVFVNLRDRSGIIQITFDQQSEPDVFSIGDQARAEWVLQIQGSVRRRPPGTENAEMPTGEVEVLAQEAKVLNRSRHPPSISTAKWESPRVSVSNTATWTCGAIVCSATLSFATA